MKFVRRITLVSVALLLLAGLGRAQGRDPFATGNHNDAHANPDGLGDESNGKRQVAMNFQDVEIPVLARFISEITGKNFIVDEKVRGKVTIISPTKVTADEAYAVFQSVLQVKGFTTVPSGRVVKIMPSREAKQAGLPTLSNGSLATAGDEFITRLVPLRHVAVADMAPVLQPLVSTDGLLIAYAPTNALILTDSAPNVRRLLGMLEELDVEGHERSTEVIALKHAIAADLAKKIEEIMKEQGGNDATANALRVRAAAATSGMASPGGGASRAVRVLPDERTNSLIVMSGPLELKAVRRLVAQLDVPLPPGTSKIHVYRLKYANAEEMLPVLADLIGARTTGGGGGGRSISAPRRERRYRREERFRQLGDRFGSGMGERSAPPEPPSAPAPAAPGASGTAPEFSSEVMVTADPATNSLIISAAPQDFATLKQVIDQLDVRRRQVYVEAIILEVSVDRARQLGIELQGAFSINGEGVGLGRVNLKDLNTLLTDPASLSGLLLAAASNKTIELPDGTRIPAQVALLRAAQRSSDINVLSAPTLLTADNQEAEILVGQNVPFVASRATDATQLRNLFATVQREDVGITLRLTPQISEGETVRLDIYEEVSAIVPTTVGDPNLVGPTTSVRSASTTVIAKSGQTVVIGGLISDNMSRQRETVPYLGDLPILGNLFRTDGDTSNKINLLIFLTPHIVRDDTEIAKHSLGERDRFRGFLREHKTPSQWQQQLDRPSFAPPPDKRSGGVLLPGTGGKP
ncbi:MAG: type II secretion system secretin GspD [Deltaproteobacteria bacterium]|nr:type II secretion system secretin GspD [Deltaproteobacteria bacterium]